MTQPVGADSREEIAGTSVVVAPTDIQSDAG